jgi:hypothetical protein
MGRLREEDRHIQPARQHGQSGHVVLVLVRNQDGVQQRRVFARQIHAPQDLTAAQTGIDEDARARRSDDGAVALGPRCQHAHSHICNDTRHRSAFRLPPTRTVISSEGYSRGSRLPHLDGALLPSVDGAFAAPARCFWYALVHHKFA